MLHPKKVGTLPVEGSDEEKQTNEIKTAIPLLDAIDIQGKTISADALLTQRDIARYLVEQRGAHYHFTVKGNQKQLLEDIVFYFDNIDRAADFTTTECGHGRIETRNIWVSMQLNDFLKFPHVGQVFMVEWSVSRTTKRVGGRAGRSLTASPANIRVRPLRHRYYRTTAVTGPTRTAVITLSIGITTKTAAASEPDMVPKTGLINRFGHFAHKIAKTH